MATEFHSTTLQVFQDACEAIEILTKVRSSQLKIFGSAARDFELLSTQEFVEQVCA
jgi:hypothetical protein